MTFQETYVIMILNISFFIAFSYINKYYFNETRGYVN